MKEVPEDRYAQWKSLVPALYDWLTNHHLMWPSLSCRYSPFSLANTLFNSQANRVNQIFLLPAIR